LDASPPASLPLLGVLRLRSFDFQEEDVPRRLVGFVCPPPEQSVTEKDKSDFSDSDVTLPHRRHTGARSACLLTKSGGGLPMSRAPADCQQDEFPHLAPISVFSIDEESENLVPRSESNDG
jgi:hypothetical protein